MDDLEHSVVIAERDWESFYEESEECSIQQARLASLDDSGFSDTDDEKNSTQEPVFDLQIKPDKPNKEPDATALTQSEDDDCKAENPSDEPRFLSYETDKERSAEQTAEINLNDVSTACACLTTDSSVGVNDGIFTHPRHTASYIKDFRKHNERRSQDKSCQAIGEPITSFPCIQDAEHVGSSGETTLKVSESLTTPKKEKERWFVTVNDSPGMLRVKSGQKKASKKKTSRKLLQESIVTEKQCSISNNKKDDEGEAMKDEQILQNEFMQPLQTYSESIYFNPCPSHFSEEVFLGSCNNQEVVSSPMKEPEKEAFEKSSIPQINCTSEASSFIAEEENIICAFNFKCKDNSDVPTETLENNPIASVNSPSPLILTDSTRLQSESLVNEQSIANKPKSNTQVTTPDHPMTNNLSHKDPEDTRDNGSTLILEVCSTTTPLEKIQEQEYPTEMQEELKLPSQEAQNRKESQKESLEAAVDPNCPIYALSSFWDEVEKLTINDILHLRSAHNRSPMSGSVITEDSDVHLEEKGLLTSKQDSVQESSLMDDSADSDYFTHVDESKPDRSSCELSNLSDFDEEFLQILNRSPSPEPQHVKEQTKKVKSTYMPGHEFDPNNASESLDILKKSHQDGIPHYLYSAIEVQSLFFTSTQDSNGNPFKMEVIRKTPVLSFDNTADNQSILSCSEISTKDINGAGSSDRLSSTAVSFPFAENLSVGEMYDDFFSNFEVGNFLFPSTQDKTVPIFSVSRSVVRDLVFPVVEDLEFDPDFEEDNMPIRDTTCFDSQPEMSTSPPGMPNLCFSMSQRGNWSSLFSLRRIRFTGKGSTWHHKVSSWIFPKEAKKATSYVSRAQQIAPPMQVENKSLLQLAEPQKHAVLISKDVLFSIKQADMCLVCIAFASWVLKSSNSQSTDMWKTALLANVSAVSAIQYLRKYRRGQIWDDP